ncbi:SGNH/GDSL hydrolase family protein [Terrihabitans rhizophilus]|uniref:SGNH/GDSL hydrolase family protein n=1 Tax=Terrihabitans rhizophilus TaxID=3092662 RepID=A0ABU4RRN7_9HYPH|nr:SGNH/GDSL hydrolase family protein [Terrihabitans sp. PJ23]MDX6806295.1 SGNH/GDSL hydrolase family protein [Terrihabitans sp. PJ23]
MATPPVTSIFDYTFALPGSSWPAKIAEFFSGAKKPYCYNFKDSNTAKLQTMRGNVRSGKQNGRVICMGDSIPGGHGTGTGANGFSGARQKAFPRKVAEQVNRELLPAQSIAITGGAGVSGGVTVQDYYGGASRLVPGPGWGNISQGIGGGYWQNSTTSDPLAWMPEVPVDTLEYSYAQFSGAATFTVDIGGAALETVVAANAAGAAPIRKVTLGGPASLRAINWKRLSGGALNLCWATAYDSTKAIIDVWNAGISGALVDTINNTANPWSARSAVVAAQPDVVFVQIGMNNWIQNTDPTLFDPALRSLLQALMATGATVILVNPTPRAVANTPLVTQMIYVNKIVAMAIELDLPFLDLREMFVSWEVANGRSWMNDVTHPGQVGASMIAEPYAYALAA